jgi:hypothetical protein
LDYEALASRASTLITKYGRAATLSIFSGATFLPITGYYTTATYAEYAVNIAFMSVGGKSLAGDIPTGLEEKVDKIGLLPSEDLAVTPTIMDRVLVGGVKYEIVFPEEIKPATISLIWRLWLHRGA